MSAFTILIPNNTKSSTQCYKSRKKSKAYRLERNRKTAPICKWYDGLHRKNSRNLQNSRKNKWIQYNYRRQGQHTKSLQLLYIKNKCMETEIKSNTIYNDSKENEIIRFNSNKMYIICTLKIIKCCEKKSRKTKMNGETYCCVKEPWKG